jgi:acetoin utilization protein AcuB
MSHPVYTVRPEMPIQDALDQMRRDHVRRYPVVDEGGKLLGIVSETDLLNASPSDATSLNVWEVNYLLSKITVGRVMSHKVITVSEDTPLESAAAIMADNKIGGLPVLRDGELVGIITETDLFRVFLELLGAREKGIRLSFQLEDKPGELSALAKAVAETGANIIALGTFQGETVADQSIVLKVSGVDKEAIINAIKPHIKVLQDVRDCC